MAQVRIAVTYNETVGGASVISLKTAIGELISDVIDADYRQIVPDSGLEEIYESRKKRNDLFKLAKKRAALFLRDIDGLVLSGNSAMVDPRLYIESLGKEEVDLARNLAEAALVHVAVQKGIPLLGICGGHQIINVYFGGTLKKLKAESFDKQKFMDYSAIQIDPQSELGQIISRSNTNNEQPIVESFFGAHNQAIKTMGGKALINGENDYLKCTAIATDEDLSIEAIESKYGSPLMGLQFHPEVGVKGLPKRAYIFQAPTEAEIIKNRNILVAFHQAAETHHKKKNFNQQIHSLGKSERCHQASAIKKSNDTPITEKKPKINKPTITSRNFLSRAVKYITNKIGGVIRKILSYILTRKKKKLLRKKQLKTSNSLNHQKDQNITVVLHQEFLNVDTKKNIVNKKALKRKKHLKPLNPKKVGIKKKKFNKSNRKQQKGNYNNNSFFKKKVKLQSISLPPPHENTQLNNFIFSK